MPTFKLNDAVAWRSSDLDKTGVIIAVVPPNKNPKDFEPRLDAGATHRDHESYIVRGGPAGAKPNKVYWPHVALLSIKDAMTEDELAWCKTNAKTVRRLIAAKDRLANSAYMTSTTLILTKDDL